MSLPTEISVDSRGQMVLCRCAFIDITQFVSLTNIQLDFHDLQVGDVALVASLEGHFTVCSRGYRQRLVRPRRSSVFAMA